MLRFCFLPGFLFTWGLVGTSDRSLLKKMAKKGFGSYYWCWVRNSDTRGYPRIPDDYMTRWLLFIILHFSVASTQSRGDYFPVYFSASSFDIQARGFQRSKCTRPPARVDVDGR
jgi:hypothetical protein